MTSRCGWVPVGDELYTSYHDHEWGVPVHDDNQLFEFLVLEGAQAGLSWRSILIRRDGYRKAFAQFDPKQVARFGSKQRKRLLADTGIVRNRAKIDSAIRNAQAFLDVQKEFGSFDRYQWDFVGGAPIQNHWKRMSQLPAGSVVLMTSGLLDHGDAEDITDGLRAAASQV